jgi:hypothetical protein
LDLLNFVHDSIGAYFQHLSTSPALLRNCGFMKKIFTLALFALSMCSFAGKSSAAVIPTLFNTGVDASGNPLAVGSVDPHYQLVSFPAGSGFNSNSFVADTSQVPINGAWVSPGSIARWIGPTTNVVNMPSSSTTGDYIYQTTFDLTGFDPASAVITGQWTVDDTSQGIVLNGNDMGNSISGAGAFSSFKSFTLNTGFIAGINTLQFKVTNAVVPDLTNPSGLVVIMSGTANVVPEPASVISIAVGLGLVMMRKRLRRAC